MKLALLILVAWFGVGCAEQAVREPLAGASTDEVVDEAVHHDLMVASAVETNREALVPSDVLAGKPKAAGAGRLWVEVLRLENGRRVAAANFALRIRPLIRVRKSNGWYRTAEFLEYLPGEYATDETGGFILDMPLPPASRLAAFEEAALAVEVQVREPGYQQASKIAYFNASDGAEAAAVIDVRPGGSLRGRVVDSSGVPAVGVAVSLVDRHDSRFSEGRTRCGGEFLVHFSRARDAHILAWAEGKGTARLKGLVLDPDMLPGEIELVLEGSAQLSGRVTDQSGAPLAGLPLYYVKAGGDLQRGDRLYRLESSLHRGEGVQGGGLNRGLGETGSDGRFEFTGLAAGNYEIFAATDSVEHLESLLTPVPVATSSKEHELVAEIHRIAVRVLDHQGQPQSYDPLDSGFGAYEAGVWKQHEKLRVICRPSDGRGRAQGHARGFSWIASEDELSHTLALKPEQYYLLYVWHPNHEVIEHEFFVATGKADLPIDLSLSPRLPSGTIRIDLSLPEGATRVDGVRAHLYSAKSGVTLVWQSIEALQFEFECAPGSYGLEFEPFGEGPLGSCTVILDDDGFAREASYFEDLPETYRTTFEVHSARATPVVEALAGRGRIKVVLAPLESAAKPEVHLAARRPSLGEWQSLEFYRWDLHFNASGVLTTDAADADWIRPGMSRRMSGSLPIGTWILRARSSETEDTFAEFEIRAGTETSVSIELIPRKQ